MRVLATHTFQAGDLPAALQFLKRTRSELRALRLVRIWKDKLHVIDVNNDTFEIQGIGYRDPDIAPLLDALNTAYNPRTLREPVQDEFKEYSTGRRYPWAQDRVM